MPAASLDQAARDVLRRYPVSLSSVVPLGNHGGFSGARLWRVTTADGPLCLRAWPAPDTEPERLRWVHHLMVSARGAGLSFVPEVFVTSRGTTWVEHQGRLWDLTRWMPGAADFHRDPSTARLQAACTALARLHAAWAPLARTAGTCPGLHRRLERAEEWLRLVASGWHPAFIAADPVTPFAERAWQLLPDWAEQVALLLAPWRGCRWTLSPCLCDVWHDHVLYEGEVVSGLIDYGSAKVDQPAVDLARLLGSLIGDDDAAWATGLDAYAAVRPLSPDEQALARALDRTGVVVAAANWLRWLYHEGRPYDDRAAVAGRLAALVRRLEAW